MKPENRYTIICDMLRAYDSASNNTGANNVIQNPQTWRYTKVIPFYAHAAELLIECLESIDKSAERSSGQAAAIKRIYKDALNFRHLPGAVKYKEQYVICDGYRFIRLNEKPAAVPEIESDLDFDKMITDSCRAGDNIAAELPSITTLKTWIASHKTGRGKPPAPIEALPGWFCNPQFLLDMLQALPGAIAHRPEKAISPMYFECENGENGLILPVKPPKQ